MGTLFKNFRIIDPAGETVRTGDLLVENGVIKKTGTAIPEKKHDVVWGRGKILAPGLIDMHVHLREPGFEYKETILSGCRAAAAGGFTRLAAMPNTKPAADSIETIRYIIEKASRVPVNVHPVGALSRGLEGKETVDMEQLFRAGAVAFSDDGRPVMNSRKMLNYMSKAAELGCRVIDHCEDVSISEGGVMNRGTNSSRLGLVGIPKAAEEIMTARDILLAKEFGLPVHIAHVSTKTSVEMIRQAKQAGAPVTAEATPHHFTLTDDYVTTDDASTKVSPPLREEEDRKAVLEGLADGTIDIIATDHAPHSSEEKGEEYVKAPNGMIGLETCLGLVLSRLVNSGWLTLSRAIGLMTVNPAEIFGLPGGRIAPGEPADLVVIDPEIHWTVKAEDFHSMASNSPFIGMKLTGRPVMTWIRGEKVMENNKVFF